MRPNWRRDNCWLGDMAVQVWSVQPSLRGWLRCQEFLIEIQQEWGHSHISWSKLWQLRQWSTLHRGTLHPQHPQASTVLCDHREESRTCAVADRSSWHLLQGTLCSWLPVPEQPEDDLDYLWESHKPKGWEQLLGNASIALFPSISCH